MNGSILFCESEDYCQGFNGLARSGIELMAMCISAPVLPQFEHCSTLRKGTLGHYPTAPYSNILSLMLDQGCGSTRQHRYRKVTDSCTTV